MCAIGGLLRGGLRVDALRVRAVGEHDDRRRRVTGPAVGARPSRRSAAPTDRSPRCASIDVRIASPIAVPREVCSVFIAANNLLVSVVGGTSSAATPANATRPIRVPCACELMKFVAAFSAAVMRFGATSVEHIDPDTSSASMIVVEFVDTASFACGRAAPMPSTARPRISRAAGIRRRHSVRPGSAWRTRTADVTRTAARRRRRRDHQAKPSTSRNRGQGEKCPRPVEGHQTILPVRRTVRSDPTPSSRTASAVNAPASGSDSVMRRQAQIDRRGDPVELGGVGRGVVRAARRLGDVREVVGVERRLDLVAVDVDGCAVRGADPDGLDVDPGRLRGGGRRVRGVGVAVVASVAEQHDGRRTPVTDGGDGSVRTRSQPSCP